MNQQKCLLFFVAEDWYFELHFLQFALAAKRCSWRVALMCNVGQKGLETVDRIRQAGIEVFPVSLSRTGATPLMDLRVLCSLAMLVKRLKPAVIHAVALKPIIMCQVVSKIYRIPLLAMITGLGYVFTAKTVKAFVARPIVSMALRFAAMSKLVRFVVLNSEDAEWGQKTFACDNDKVTIIPGTGVDMQRFYPGLRLVDSPCKIAYVGRMLRDKGLFELIEAMRLLKKDNIDIELILAGAPDASNPESIAESQLYEWQKEGICRYLGHVTAIENLLREVHVVTLPSYREGLGMSLLEASATGLPCIATDVPGCRSAVIHEQTGLLVPVRNVKALAEAILLLANDKPLRERMGKNGIRYVRECFSREIVLGKMIGLYDQMVIGFSGCKET